MLFLFSEELLATFGMETARSRKIALVAALVWAIHPVHSSAVVYVSGLADPLAAVFGFAGCYFVLRSLRGQGSAAMVWLAASAPLFLLSALSKESGFIFLASPSC